jgi:hypothetical protein
VHAHRLVILAWTVNDSENFNRLVRLGVDGITTDNLAILQALRRPTPTHLSGKTAAEDDLVVMTLLLLLHPWQAGPRLPARAAAARSVPALPHVRQSRGPCGSPLRSSTPHVV